MEQLQDQRKGVKRKLGDYNGSSDLSKNERFLLDIYSCIDSRDLVYRIEIEPYRDFTREELLHVVRKMESFRTDDIKTPETNYFV